MKRLYLLRHAKSDRSDPGASDIDRPLNARGRRAASAIGRYLRRHKLAPDFIVCSVARRARETWEHLAPQLKLDLPVDLSKQLYLATPPRILDLIRRLPEDRNAVLLLGHNPGLHVAALQLIGAGDERERQRLQSKYPTAALLVVDFEAPHWRDIAPGSGRLRQYIVPRDLT
jgi:phosphohistidine phosphatase